MSVIASIEMLCVKCKAGMCHKEIDAVKDIIIMINFIVESVQTCCSFSVSERDWFFFFCTFFSFPVVFSTNCNFKPAHLHNTHADKTIPREHSQLPSSHSLPCKACAYP